MKRAVIIPTFKDSPFLKDLLQSLIGCKYPIIIHWNTLEKNEYEMGAIRIGKELEIDEFVVLPDSVIIKDLSLLDRFFKLEGESVCLDLDYLSYVGKYRYQVLKWLTVPTVTNKKDAVLQEFEFHKKYCQIEKPIRLFPGFWNDLAETFEEKHGRNNLINENEYIKKYKGCWTPEMLNNYEEPK